MIQFASAQLPNFTQGFQDGGVALDIGYGISTDSNNNLIYTGFFDSTSFIGDSTFSTFGKRDIFLSKFDQDGTFLWARQFGGTNPDIAEGVTTDGFDNIIITGSFEGTADFGDTTLTSAGEIDIFLAKYDMNGNLIWARRMGGLLSESGKEVATDDDDNIVVTGFYTGRVSFGDTTLQSVGLSQDIFVAKYYP